MKSDSLTTEMSDVLNKGQCEGLYVCGWCLFWCFFRLLGSENLSAHNAHWYGLSPVWMFLWIFRFQNWENFLPQIVQP